ncbi:hypothetical protein ERJ75_000705600 [Trypanosoma vivax]|nr:hypothetical protein TRVL_00166 [Trypanosoma vivax]KAH8613901.1 hypothetical protein ERJ75_000705600 [Trypanosoma vivax]
MEPPAKLNDFFTIVDDFFKKTFRDESSIFCAIKSSQYSESFPGKELFFEQPTPKKERKFYAAKGGKEEEVMGSRMPNYMAFSPRLILRKDGSSVGKVKLSCGILVPQVCRAEQTFALDNEGVVTSRMRLSELFEGLDVKGRISINTIAPASKDVWTVTTNYQRMDFYSALEYQRNGMGSSDFLVDCGTKFFNLLCGAGFERQKLSYLEQQDAASRLDVLYTGIGFTGVNWSMGAKLVRSNDIWSAARIALYQRIAPSTSVACSYNYDIEKSEVHLSMGFSQGFRLRVPTILQRHEESNIGAWSTVVPLVGAFKAECNGLCAATIRGIFNGVVHWGLVMQKNVLRPSSPVRFGLTLSLEQNS